MLITDSSPLCSPLFQVVCSLTILSTSHVPSLLSSSIWVHRIFSLTSKGSRLLGTIFTPTCLYTQDTWLHTTPTCFSVRHKWAAFLPRTKRFGFDEAAWRNCLTCWLRGFVAPLSTFLSSPPRLSSSEESDFTQSNTQIFTRNVQLWLWKRAEPWSFL